jgi:hypothetical protein
VETRAVLLRRLAPNLKVLPRQLAALLLAEAVRLTPLLLLTLLVLLLLQVEVLQPVALALALAQLVAQPVATPDLVDSAVLEVFSAVTVVSVATEVLVVMPDPRAALVDFSVEVVLLTAALAAFSAAAQRVALQSKFRAWAASLAQALVQALLAATSPARRLPKLPLAARPRRTLARPLLILPLVTRVVPRLVLRLA